MVIRWLAAAVHLLALGIGLGAGWARSRALRRAPDEGAVRFALGADAAWGIAALLWVSTGLWRAFGGLEKGTAYYVANHVFWLKMALFVVITAMEIPMAVALGRWRTRLRRGEAIDTARAGTFATLGTVQAALVVAMVFAATAMARGFGM
jgi:putative membrane protein